MAVKVFYNETVTELLNAHFVPEHRDIATKNAKFLSYAELNDNGN